MNNEVKEILEEINKIIDNTLYNEEFTYFQTSHISKLLDYITNLERELQITQEKWDKDKQWAECRTKEWLDYKSRLEKASEYIDKQKKKMYKSRNKIAMFILMKLENILQNGSDK